MKTRFTWLDTTRTMWKPQSHWLIADWLEPVEPAPPGEDSAPCSDHKSLRISTTPTPRNRKRCSPGPTPPCTVWKPQRRWRIADRLRLVHEASATQVGWGPSLTRKPFNVCIYNSDHGRTNTEIPRVDTARCGNNPAVPPQAGNIGRYPRF